MSGRRRLPGLGDRPWSAAVPSLLREAGTGHVKVVCIESTLSFSVVIIFLPTSPPASQASSQIDHFDALPLPHPHVTVAVVLVAEAAGVNSLSVRRLLVRVERRSLTAGLNELQPRRVRETEDA